jgi:hypothetical protein
MPKTENEETPAPVTASKDGRGSSGVRRANYARQTLVANAKTLLLALVEDAVLVDGMRPYSTALPEQMFLELIRYQFNMAVCEALYPSIHCLELALRTAIHSALVQVCGSERWFEQKSIMTPYQQRMIEEAAAKAAKKRGRSTGAVDDVLAELSLGFWTAFFNKDRAATPDAPKLIRRVFKYAPKYLRRLDEVDRRLTRFRRLRNRVFHHERIEHWGDLAEQHRELGDTLGWISPDLARICHDHDRFPDVIQRGYKH